ncbi:hypothetical protein [Solirubrobacter soli]|uniref:hypothetical protein n=1 Tax=Solirubrobacter soli TaxID=363832 RepID=UPI00048316C0|nr:hypothetical protein [Solirubrobacter soli]
MLVLDREAAVEHWRRAEARIYPSVMVNAELYQQYIGVVRAVAEELRDVRTEDDLVAAWHERGDVVREVVSRSAPPMLAIMDLGAVRDAAFCHRHRELTREQGKALAAERLLRARMSGAEWVVLFEDVTPLGSHRLEMHVASGRAMHAAAELPLDAGKPKFTLEVVQLDPADGAWQLDKAPAMPEQTFDTREEWEARIEQARVLFGRR